MAKKRVFEKITGLVFLGFYWVLLVFFVFFWFYWVLLILTLPITGFIGFYWFFSLSWTSFGLFSIFVLWSYFWLQPSLLQGFMVFYGVLLGFIGFLAFFWIILGLFSKKPKTTRFWWVFWLVFVFFRVSFFVHCYICIISVRK